MDLGESSKCFDGHLEENKPLEIEDSMTLIEPRMDFSRAYSPKETLPSRTTPIIKGA